MLSHVRCVVSTLALLVVPVPLSAQTPAAARQTTTDSAEVADALQRFLTAFENLDWQPFRAAFSDSDTVFHPAPNMPGRVSGRAAIDSTFTSVFAGIRAQAPGGPPYHRLTPVDLLIQPLAPGLVLVTFELRNRERQGRRTVLVRREGSEWRIVHLHASNIATAVQSPSRREKR